MASGMLHRKSGIRPCRIVPAKLARHVVRPTRPRAASATLRRGAKILARGRVSKGGRVTLTTALRPRPGTYTLRIGTTRITVRLR